MSATLFIEPFGGMAGDMLLAALLDLGDPRFALADLQALADELVPGEARLAAETVWRRSLSGLHLDVATPETEAPPHRHLADLVVILDRSSLGSAARRRAVDALTAIAEAEGRVHGCSPDEVHFHEVGAVDTLIDVGGAALALERLGVERIVVSPPLVGSGTVHCAHGEMPVPAPATAELLRGVPHRLGGGGERLTPTAAAIVATWTDEHGEPGEFTAAAIGYGAGSRDPQEGPPNLLRVQLGREGAATRDEVWQLEVTLDDMTPQAIGHAVCALRSAGALEAWTAAVQMKKDRPGVVLTALARGPERADLERVVFAETTTLGLRWTRVERREARRESFAVDVDGVTVRVKRRLSDDGIPARDQPEADDVARLAAERGLSFEEAAALVLRAAREGLSEPTARP